MVIVLEEDRLPEGMRMRFIFDLQEKFVETSRMAKDCEQRDMS